MYSIRGLTCLPLSGLPCWLCFRRDAGFTTFMAGMETPPLCRDRIWGEGVRISRRKLTPAPLTAGRCRSWAATAGAVVSLPGRLAVTNQGQGHQLRVPKEPPQGELRPARTHRQPPLQRKQGVRGKNGEHGKHREMGDRGSIPPGQGCTTKRKEQRPRQAEADSRWKRRQWEHKGFY